MARVVGVQLDMPAGAGLSRYTIPDPFGADRSCLEPAAPAGDNPSSESVILDAFTLEAAY